MKWVEIFAKLLPLVFGIVPQLQAHAQTAVDATKVVSDTLAFPGATSTSVKSRVLATVSDSLSVANDELVAAGKAPLDPNVILAAADAATDTAIDITHLVHAAHGTGAAPMPAAV
jgi:hypothetical protein